MNDIHCPYINCTLKCINKESHKAKYANMNYKNSKNKNSKNSKNKNSSELEHHSPKVNWEKLKEMYVLYSLILSEKS